MRGTGFAVLALLLLVGGCMPTKPGASAGSPRACMAENVAFLQAWACVRARLVARRQDGTMAPRDGLIEEGDLLAEQVRAGKVPEADARKRLDSGLAHEPL